MTLLNKEPVKRVEKILKEFDESLSVIVLETSARTANEAASSLGCEVGAIVKSLLFKTENSFTLCLVAGDKRASLNSIKKSLKIKDASMASAEDVKNA
jgi:prolyl-tRNA editing enzyme YbaK/EbsC (Cys-tRNA(Pro) deacylase)